MQRAFSHVLIAICLLFPQPRSLADDANRLLVTVTKKTLAKVPGKVLPGDEPSRMQTLAVAVTNQSVRPLPAGTIQWTVLIRKHSGDVLKHFGKADLAPVASFKTVEVTCGLFEVAGHLASSGAERDRVEYDIAVLHGRREIYRTTSVANFAALSEKAQVVTAAPGAGEAADAKVAKAEDPSAPKPANDAKPAQPLAAMAEKPPAEKPAAPTADAKPVAEPPPVPQQTFDFFNLRGKTAPAAK